MIFSEWSSDLRSYFQIFITYFYFLTKIFGHALPYLKISDRETILSTVKGHISVHLIQISNR